MENRPMGGRFVIEREVGRGGAGVVYRAWDLVTEQYVALKVLPVDAGDIPAEEQRLVREGELVSHLDHPGIVKIVAYGVLEESGMPFVAMEWLEGEDLSARHKRSPLSLRQAVELSILVARSLATAHGAGIIHRDIKPGNVVLIARPDSAGELDVWPKLVDFGVAARGDIRITRTGDVVGTPAYMAPEQARGDAPVDARCDIYSLGATLFELITGRPPHVGASPIATLARLVTTPAPRLSELRRDTPPLLDNIVNRMLATEPEHRPADMHEVADGLEDALKELERMSWPNFAPTEPALSTRLGSSASRLVTSIVALRFGKASARERALEQLRQRGAEAVPLGAEAIVAHLGARRAVGTEAAAALELGRKLARAGARVGIASGRARVNM
jgi:serine/threonine protein kinase